MKRFLSLTVCFVLTAVLLLSSVSMAVAETITLTAGVYNVGKDIPAGEYEILCTEASDPYNDYLDLMKSLSGDDESLQALWSLYGGLVDEPTVTVTIRGTSGEKKKSFELEKNAKKVITLENDYSIKIEDGTCTLELKKELASTQSSSVSDRSSASSDEWTCPNCGNSATGNFCNNCGTARPEGSTNDSNSSENDDVIGTWHAVQVVYNGVTVDIAGTGMYVTMQLNANGSVTISSNDSEEEGTWTRNANTIVLTTDDSGTVNCSFEGGKITLKEQGNEIIFSKDLTTTASTSLPSPITATSEDQFFGTWNMSKVAAQGIVLTPVELAAMGSSEDITFIISRGEARADIITNGRSDYNKFNTTFSNGRLQLKSKINSVVLSVVLTDSGELMTTTTSDGITRQIYFTKEADGQSLNENSSGETEAAESSTPSPTNTPAPTQKPASKPTTINADFSDTKHYQRIKDYVGMSLDDVGYTSMGGDRLEEYGKTHLKFNYIPVSGEFIDIENESQLSQYTVIGQSIDPDTPLVITYQTNSSGIEYDNLIDWQSIDQIDLYVAKKGQNTTLADYPGFVETYIAPDKYTNYVRNYVGKNLTSVGYTSMGGDRLDEYGKVYLKLVFVGLNGEYIDIQDTSSLSDYMVVAQNITPNTEFKITYQKNSSGEEYSNLIDWQGLSSIELYVVKVGTDLSTIEIPQIVPITSSEDKYTEHVKNYVGKNLASFGYTSMGGDRLEEYGKVYVEFCFITPDGEYLDIEDTEQLQQYYVVAQSIAPNTEFKITYQKNSSGEEYSNLTEWQGIKNIDLLVAKNGLKQTSSVLSEIVQIKPSPDKHTWYLRNYVGMNLAAFGYTSWGGKKMDEYGAGYIEFRIVSEGGESIDPEDSDALKSYVVVKQDVQPNTPIEFVFSTNSRGEEYSNLLRSQSLEKVTLTVKKIESVQPIATENPTEAPTDIPSETTSVNVQTEESSEPSYSANDVRTSGKFQYVVLGNGNAQIVGYTGKDSSISISSSIDGHDITSIGNGAFKGNSSLKTITIWADIVDFGDEAFMGCSSLKKISIPGSARKIGKNAFKDCVKLESVTIWGDLDGIRESTFENCKALKKISISSTAKFIDKRAFYGCEKMTSATIWGDPEYIGESAFEGCSSLQKISIPSSTKKIEDSAFKGCSSMSSVTIWGDANIGNYAFQGCSKISKINISSGTEYIGDYAFEGCTNLSKVTMWGRNTTIGIGAFDNCPNLSNPPKGSSSTSTSREQATATPSPAAQETPTPRPTDQKETVPISNGGKEFQEGKYLVGRDIAPGKYLFTGTGPSDIYYSCPNDRFDEDTYIKEGSIWKKGDSAVIDLEDNTYFMITLHPVQIDRYEVTITDDQAFELPVGTYHVGTDIDPGNYLFVGTGPADILLNCPDNKFKEDTYIKEGSIWKAGDSAVLDLKENTFFQVTLHSVIISKYQLSLPENEEVELPVGIYHIGTDIPEGKYYFIGKSTTDILYNCADGSFAEGTFIKEGSIWSDKDIVALDLAKDTYIYVQLHAVNIKRFSGIDIDTKGTTLPVGIYHVGEDFPAGTYTFVGTNAADILYNCPDNQFRDESYKKDGSIWSEGDTTTLTLKDNTYIQITIHPVIIKK